MRPSLLAEIQSLHALGASLERAGPIDTLLQKAAESVARMIPCDRVALVEIDQDHRSVGFFAAGGAGVDQVVRTVTYDELQNGLTGWALREQRSAVSPKGAPDPRESPEVQRRRRETNCGSIVVTPLRMAGHSLGTLTAIQRVDAPDFTEEDVALIEVVAHYCALVIQNARHYQSLRRTNEEIDALNRALQDRNSLKDTLFTILAHDLRGPVGNMVMIMEALSDEKDLGPDLIPMVSAGSRAAEQTYNLLDNLLTWVRSQMDGIEVLKVRFPLAKTLQAVQDWLLPQATRKRQTFVVECPGHLTAFTDEHSLETILRNLVANAIKYSPPGASIVLRAGSAAGHVWIEVRDPGRGMTPEVLNRLFGPKKVQPRPGTSGELGSGLGLMFSGDLVHSLGGTLDAQSVVGQGSVFRVTLPDEVDGELDSGPCDPGPSGVDAHP